MKIKKTPTQERMSEFLGIAQGTVSVLISGKKPMSLKMAKRMEEIFPQTTYTWWLDIKPTVIGRFWETNIPHHSPKTKRSKTKTHKHSQNNENKCKSAGRI